MKPAYAVIIFCCMSFRLLGQGNDLEVRVGNSILRGALKEGVTRDPDSYMHIFRVKTSADGVISSINLLSNEDLKNPLNISIDRNGNSVSVLNEKSINTIQWTKNTLQVVGPYFTRKSKTLMEVLVSPRKAVIYESSEIVLGQPSKGALKESFRKKPSDFTARSYRDGVLLVEYREAGNINFKFAFRKEAGKVLADYYYAAGNDDYDKYSPAIEIRGRPLHSGDEQVNVINYFILQAASAFLSELLFPGIFLPE